MHHDHVLGVMMMCVHVWEGLICFGTQLVGLVERHEMKLFRIFWSNSGKIFCHAVTGDKVTK